jgi:hypothetical protein
MHLAELALPRFIFQVHYTFLMMEFFLSALCLRQLRLIKIANCVTLGHMRFVGRVWNLLKSPLKFKFFVMLAFIIASDLNL